MGHIHGHLVLHSGYQSWQGKGRNGWGGLVDCYPYTIIHCQWIIKESRFPVNNRLLITWIMYRFRNHVTYHVFQSIILFNVVFFIIKWNHVSCSRFAGNGIVLIVRPYQTDSNVTEHRLHCRDLTLDWGWSVPVTGMSPGQSVSDRPPSPFLCLDLLSLLT